MSSAGNHGLVAHKHDLVGVPGGQRVAQQDVDVADPHVIQAGAYPALPRRSDVNAS